LSLLLRLPLVLVLLLFQDPLRPHPQELRIEPLLKPTNLIELLLSFPEGGEELLLLVTERIEVGGGLWVFVWRVLHLLLVLVDLIGCFPLGFDL
jgi:hypothetical protein